MRRAAVRVGPAGDVARREDSGRAGLQVRVDRDAAVERESRLLGERQPRPHADAGDDQVRADRAAALQRRPGGRRSRSRCPPGGRSRRALRAGRARSPPSAGPARAPSARFSGATTCTSMPRARSEAATSRPMKLAPITTARRAVAARAMMARQSPRVRSVCTCGRSMPGSGSRTRLRTGREQQSVVGHLAAVAERDLARRHVDADDRRPEPQVDALVGVVVSSGAAEPTPPARCRRGSPWTDSACRRAARRRRSASRCCPRSAGDAASRRRQSRPRRRRR